MRRVHRLFAQRLGKQRFKLGNRNPRDQPRPRHIHQAVYALGHKSRTPSPHLMRKQIQASRDFRIGIACRAGQHNARTQSQGWGGLALPRQIDQALFLCCR